MTEPPPLGLDLTRPEPVPAAGIERATQLMRSGRLFRYGEESQSSGEVSLLEQEAARLLGRRYAVAVNSCGAALFLALRVCGVRPGDEVLVNGYTLAPVPGAIEHAGARAVLVEADDHLTIDLDDLRRKAAGSSARVLLLSHMRGHLADLPRVRALCDELGLLLVEDCAHTLGAAWASQPTGTFGEASCLSLQTFKHLNAGEGGLLLLDDDERAARAILHSGSYMHYAQHAARPPLEAFEPLRGEVANFSMRMSELAAAVARPQLPLLPERVEAMNRTYRDLEHRLEQIPGVRVVPRRPEEQYVGSSLQFHLRGLDAEQMAAVVEAAGRLGLHVKWHGAARMAGFTSRPDQWRHVDSRDQVPRTTEALATLCDLRIPPAMRPEHCERAAAILTHAVHAAATSPAGAHP